MDVHYPQPLAGTPTVYLHCLPPLSSAPLTVVSLHCLPPVVSPCCRCLPLLLSIPIGGDVAVSTHSALQANACSGGGQMLGCCHCCHLPPSSLTTHPPLQVVVSPPSPLVIVIIPPIIHSMNSCSSGWRRVVCCPSSSWGLGTGGLVTCQGWWSCTPIAPPVPLHEQWLMAVVGLLSLSVPFHP
jgi:hypothetical protein